MTVIIAHAAAGRAFIAGDTKRSGMPLPVRKVHVWSDQVLFGQAGNGTYMSKAIAAAFACQGLHGDDLAGLIASFDAARKAVYPQSVAANANSSLAAGTLLIACSDPASGGPSIWTIELDPTVAPTLQAGPVFGIGTVGIAASAAALWAGGVVAANTLPTWATACISAHRGPTVAWPIDMVVAQPSLPGERAVLHQRLASPTSTPDPGF